MKKCMIKYVRSAAGLGDPPNKWVNNRHVCFNHSLNDDLVLPRFAHALIL